MKTRMFVALGFAGLLSLAAFADPIHALANGDYWHHDSGWIFPKRCGEFVRIGAAQDVAGTRDAVAHYSREAVAVPGGEPLIITVDVYPQDSAADHTTLDPARETQIASVATGEWRVRIRASLPAATGEVARELAAFVQAQRWDTLDTH